MTETYKKLNSILRSNRPEFHFHPQTLDALTEEERKEIEERLARAYLSGNSGAINYFPYFQYFNGGEILKKTNKENFSLPALAEYYKTLYLCTKDINYLTILLSGAESDIDSFRALIELYNETHNDEIKRSLDKIYQVTKDIDYKFLYEKMLVTEDMGDIMEKARKRETEKAKKENYFFFQEGDLNMVDKNGNPLPLEQQKLIIRMKRELYLREHPEERENEEVKKK